MEGIGTKTIGDQPPVEDSKRRVVVSSGGVHFSVVISAIRPPSAYTKVNSNLLRSLSPYSSQSFSLGVTWAAPNSWPTGLTLGQRRHGRHGQGDRATSSAAPWRRHISLPPPDDPSKGKTITAFAFSDDSPLLRQSLPHRATAARAPLARTGRRFVLTRWKSAAIFLGLGLIIFSLLICLFSEAPLQLLGEPEGQEGDRRREEERRSFLLPLYHKSGSRSPRQLRDVKLDSFDGLDDAGLVKRKQSRKVETSSSTNSSVVLPIGGNLFPDGQYYTTIFVGTSPRPYFLDVDTGSGLTWIQCDAPCTSCAKGPHPLYKPNRRNVVLPQDSLCMEVQRDQNYHCDSCQQCDYGIEYADHSSSIGVLARDEMHISATNGEKAKFNFAFGCAYDQQGQLLTSPAKTDGILGLSNSKVSLPYQLASQGIIRNVLGHCIKHEADGEGYMFLGDDFVPGWGMTWIPTPSGLTNYYEARALKINYGGKQIAGHKGDDGVPVIFDTGSSYTYFPDEAYGQLITSLKSIYNNFVQDVSDLTLPICWRPNFSVRSFKDLKKFFEPLSLQFEKKWWFLSQSFTIFPEGYLIINNKGNVCLGILNGSEVHDGATIILGDISLRGKLVVYDNVQQKTGWTDSECSKPQKPTRFPYFI